MANRMFACEKRQRRRELGLVNWFAVRAVCWVACFRLTGVSM
jgi:hypothetical protein